MQGANLYVGGSFSATACGDVQANGVAMWNGNSWNFLGTSSSVNGISGSIVASVNALAVMGSNL